MKLQRAQAHIHATAETSYNLYWADAAFMKLLLIAKLPASSSSLELCLQQLRVCLPIPQNAEHENHRLSQNRKDCHAVRPVISGTARSEGRSRRSPSKENSRLGVESGIKDWQRMPGSGFEPYTALSDLHAHRCRHSSRRCAHPGQCRRRWR